MATSPILTLPNKLDIVLLLLVLLALLVLLLVLVISLLPVLPMLRTLRVPLLMEARRLGTMFRSLLCFAI